MRPGQSEALLEGFETWLLRRVAQTVQAGEMSADLLAELQTASEAAREKRQEDGHATVVQDIAEALEIPLEQIKRGLETLEPNLRSCARC